MGFQPSLSGPRLRSVSTQTCSGSKCSAQTSMKRPCGNVSQQPMHRTKRCADRRPYNWCLLIIDLQLLQEFGLDFHFVLDEVLVPNPSKLEPAPSITVQAASETTTPRAESPLPTPTPRRQRNLPPGYPAPPPRSRDRPLSIIQVGKF